MWGAGVSLMLFVCAFYVDTLVIFPEHKSSFLVLKKPLYCSVYVLRVQAVSVLLITVVVLMHIPTNGM